MTRIISIASGKGGVGKSMLAANLGLLLARKGLRTVIADLDVGGADIHVLFGEFNPRRTISDFLYRRVEELAEVVCPLPFKNLAIIPGTGDTLATANMRFTRKRRLINSLKKIDAEIIIIDVGAGTSFHTLDFFLAADLYITITTPEPAAILDLYRFVKLAAIRKVVSGFIGYGQVSEALAHEDFSSIDQVIAAVEKTAPNSRARAEEIIRAFTPRLVLNRVSGRSKTSIRRLQLTLRECVGCNIATLGEIPDDPAVAAAIRSYLPVVNRGRPDRRQRPCAPLPNASRTPCRKGLAKTSRKR